MLPIDKIVAVMNYFPDEIDNTMLPIDQFIAVKN